MNSALSASGTFNDIVWTVHVMYKGYLDWCMAMANQLGELYNLLRSRQRLLFVFSLREGGGGVYTRYVHA